MAAAYSSTPDSVAPQVSMLTLRKSPRKIPRKIKTIKLFTLEPEVNRFREYRPGESGPRVRCRRLQPSKTTIKFGCANKRRTGCVGRLAEGGGLISNLLHTRILILNIHTTAVLEERISSGAVHHSTRSVAQCGNRLRQSVVAPLISQPSSSARQSGTGVDGEGAGCGHDITSLSGCR